MIKCLGLTALVFAICSIGFAQSKTLPAAPDGIVGNFYTMHKAALNPFAQTKNRTLVGSGSEEIKRRPNESAAAFAARNAPLNSKLTKVIEAVASGSKNMVVAIYRVQSETAPQITGYMFLPTTSPSTYKKVLIDFREFEGLNPDMDVAAVFFANADKDRAEELVILGSFGVHSAETMGTYHQTFIFDDIRPGTDPPKLTYLKAISEKVSGGCDCMDEKGGWPAKRYQTAAKVRAGLKRLGF